MEAGAVRGTEKIKRTLLKQLIIRRSICTFYSLISFAMGSYLKYIGSYKYQWLCICLPMTLDGFVVCMYNAYQLHTRGAVLLGILSKVVNVSKSQINSKTKTETEHDKKFEKTFKTFTVVIPLVKQNLMVNSLVLVGQTVWGVVVVGNEYGMMYFNVVQGLTTVFCILPICLGFNQLFVKW